MADDLLNSYMSGPDEQGRFGIFGGRFVSETLMPLILDLQAEYEKAKTDPVFKAEMDELWTHYVGRPSPLYKADQIKAKMLLIHGENDTNVPVQESLQFREALVASGNEPELLIVPGEGHQFVKPESRELIAETMLNFFARLGCIPERDN